MREREARRVRDEGREGGKGEDEFQIFMTNGWSFAANSSTDSCISPPTADGWTGEREIRLLGYEIRRHLFLFLSGLVKSERSVCIYLAFSPTWKTKKLEFIRSLLPPKKPHELDHQWIGNGLPLIISLDRDMTKSTPLVKWQFAKTLFFILLRILIVTIFNA